MDREGVRVVDGFRRGRRRGGWGCGTHGRDPSESHGGASQSSVPETERGRW